MVVSFVSNPDQSYLWLQPLILSLAALDGVGFVRCVMRSYGSMFWKPVAFLSNILGMEKMACVPEYCEPGPLCRGQIEWNGEMVFVTKFTQAHMPAMVAEEAVIIKEVSFIWENAKLDGKRTPML